MHRLGDFYIDLGTANTLICTKSKGLQVNEPTVLSVNKGLSQNIREYVLYGAAAKKALGKSPLVTQSIQPLKEGVISDFSSTLSLLDFYVKQLGRFGFFNRPRLIISLPHEVSSYERTAVEEVGKELGAKRVDLVSEPMMAAIGAGLDVLSSRGCMIVDIGGGTSEAAIISLGGVVVSQSRRIGGVSLDVAIIQHLKNKYHFLIGEQTAEKLKVKIGSALPLISEPNVDVGGIDLKTALPRRMNITSHMIFEPINTFVKEIVSMISKTLEVCPPELASDLIDKGIVLAGGGALIEGLPQRISQETGVFVSISREPLFSVSCGGTQILNDYKLFDKIEST